MQNKDDELEMTEETKKAIEEYSKMVEEKIEDDLAKKDFEKYLDKLWKTEKILDELEKEK